MKARLNHGRTLIAAALAVAGASCASAPPVSAPLPAGEPVAVGYATVAAGAGRSAGTPLSRARLAEPRARKVEDLLASRFPGVRVTRLSDGRVSIRIRGPNTILGNREPLLVVDGVPLEHDIGGVLRDMYASDVARIEVLKDDASAAIFGVRGGGGVIIITTRRAR